MVQYFLLNSPEKLSPISAAPKSIAEQKWEIGQVIDDKYEIQGIIAQDARKVIYKVHHTQWNIPLAVRSQLDKESQVGFFHQAARWVELDKHPNVVSAYYVHNIGGIPRLFVEYVKDARTLEQFLRKEKYDLETALDIAIQICWGMEHAHKKGLLHGDLRPGNIFITQDGDAKIADFRSRENVDMQYSAYMPPEQMEKDFLAQPAVDIYAFGVLLYQLGVGELPFKAPHGLSNQEDITNFKNMMLTNTPQAPHKLNPQISPSLSCLIMECLAPNHEARPRHFEDLSLRLQAIYTEVTGFTYPRKSPDAAMLAAVDLNNRGLSFLDLRQQQEAEDCFAKAVAESPECTGALINLYLLRLRTGKASLAQLLAATEPLLASARQVATFYRGKICLEQGGFIAHALQEVEQTLKQFPDNKELLRLKGMLLKRMMHYDKAIEIFQELVDNTKTPSLADIYYHASSFLEKGTKEKAREVWEKGLSLYPEDSYLLIGLGLTMALQGKVEEAINYFRQFTSPHTGFWPHLHLAELTAAFGDYVKPYSKLTPDLDQAHRLYDALIKQAPRMSRIYRAYRKLFNKEPAIDWAALQEKIPPMWSYVRSLDGHEGGIHCMAISPDGRLVVAGGSDKNLRIWEIATGKCKKVMEAHPEGISQISISPDGHFVVSIGRDHVVMVWDLIAGECVAKLEGHVREVTCIALTTTGYLVTGSSDKTLRIWDLGALSCRTIFKGHDDKINCVAVTPDGRIAISGGEDAKIGIWDIEQEMLIHFLEGHTQGVTCLAVSPNGKLLVSGGWDQKIRIYEIASGKCISTLEGHTGTLNSVVVTQDGNKMISASEDKTVRIWDIAAGQNLATLYGHTGDVTCITVSPTGKFLVSGSWDHTLRVWDLNRCELLCVLEGHTDLINTVAVAPDERFILSGGDDPVLRVWSELNTLLCPQLPEHPLSYLLQSPPSQHGNLEGQRKVQKLIGEAEAKAGQQDVAGAMHIYRSIQTLEGFANNHRVLNAIYQTAKQGSLKRARPRAIWKHKILRGHKGEVACMAISAKENMLVSGSKDGTLKVWDIQEGVCVKTLEGHKSAVVSVDISPNSRFVVSGSWDKTLRLWELETGQCVYTMEGHNHWVEHVRFTPDGRNVISASRDKVLRVWERKTGHRLYSGEHMDLISALHITPDGRYLVTGSHDRTVKVWELESGQCLHTLEKHSEHVRCLASVPNTPLLLSGGWDGTVFLWNLETGENVSAFTGHQSWINDICVTTDGKRAISCSLDKTVKVWDIASSQCIETLKGHTQDINHVLVTADGNFCLSSSWDNTLRIWDLNTYECCNVLQGHSDIVTTMQMLQNYRYVITGSKDQTLIIWEFDWDWA